MERLTVLDILTPKAGREAEVKESLRSLAGAEFTAAVAHGAQRFTLREELNGDRFLLEEQWESRGSFDNFHKGHRPSELLQFLERADDLLEIPLQSSVSFWHDLTSHVPKFPPGSDGRQIVEAVFDRISALDAVGLIDLFAEDGRQVLPYAPEGFPQAFDGRRELKKAYETLLAQYASVNFIELQISQIDAGDRWLATYRTEIDFRRGGQYRNEYISLFRLESRRLVEWTEFFNPIVLQRELGNPFNDQTDAASRFAGL